MITKLSLYKERSPRNLWRHCGQVMNWPGRPAKNHCLGLQCLCVNSSHIVALRHFRDVCLRFRSSEVSRHRYELFCSHLNLFHPGSLCGLVEGTCSGSEANIERCKRRASGGLQELRFQRKPHEKADSLFDLSRMHPEC
jgi:hypothetical protein